jgi:hypothetical protein
MVIGWSPTIVCTKRKTTDHQQEKIKEYEKNRTRIFLPKWAVGRPWLRDEANRMVCKIKIKIGQVTLNN